MTDWGYGVLKSDGGMGANPVYAEHREIGPGDSVFIKLKGNGKVIQIGFKTTDKHTTFSVDIDGSSYPEINNSFCLEEFTDTRGNGFVTWESEGKHGVEWHKINCLIPFIFNKEIVIKINNKSNKNINMRGLHIYYLVPWK